MAVTSFAASITSILVKAPQVVKEVNDRCAALGLPPALTLTLSPPDVDGNTDYTFEGFGLVFGFPPQVSFYVHYKKGSPQHKEIGRFLIPL
ncbi:hypothetical protein H6F89_03125 [Cyanobacteria bacterium FACHB-63]|nr:hypothetical protein [Cyanobacteria bacterium FACHB-63]